MMTERSDRNCTPAEVFGAFLKLGPTLFSAPVAQLRYLRDDLVMLQKWVTEKTYADPVALCRSLPGPAFSPVRLAMGLMRGGWLGATAAMGRFQRRSPRWSAFQVLRFTTRYSPAP